MSSFEWNPRRTDKSKRKCKHLVLRFHFCCLELRDWKAGVMEFWLHSFPVLLIDRDKKYAFAGYVTQHELLMMGALGANFRHFFSVGKFAIKDKDVCEIFDLNYRSPSVNLMGFATGRDEKYL